MFADFNRNHSFYRLKVLYLLSVVSDVVLVVEGGEILPFAASVFSELTCCGFVPWAGSASNLLVTLVFSLALVSLLFCE